MSNNPNFDKWQTYCSSLPVPQSFVDWAFYHVIGACLQRRVWCSSTGQPCFANTYPILTGPPGIGKGLILREVSAFMSHWNLEDVLNDRAKIGSNGEDKAQSEALALADLEKAKSTEMQSKNKQTELAKPKLFPIGSNATTYQALIEAIGECYRHINYIDDNGKLRPYGHSSVSIILPELSDLLRQKTEDTVRLLLGLYDCPIDFEYRTMTRGKDRIRRGCLNLIAGTTPGFMKSTFDDSLTDEGFTSRVFFVYAHKKRFSRFKLPNLAEDQLRAKLELLEHIKNLSQLYGQVITDQETDEFLEEWWQKYENDPTLHSNKSPQLRPYYSRKNIHVMKIAMAMHFGESVLMKIPLERFKDAIAFLEREEKCMHLALTLEGNSPESKATRRILDLLRSGPKNFVDILVEVMPLIGTSKQATDDVLTFLVDTGQITLTQTQDETTGDSINYWSLKKNE